MQPSARSPRGLAEGWECWRSCRRGAGGFHIKFCAQECDSRLHRGRAFLMNFNRDLFQTPLDSTIFCELGLKSSSEHGRPRSLRSYRIAPDSGGASTSAIALRDMLDETWNAVKPISRKRRPMAPIVEDQPSRRAGR